MKSQFGKFQLLKKIATEPPVPVTQHRSDLPAPVLRILERMLAKDAEERPSAAEAQVVLSETVS